MAIAVPIVQATVPHDYDSVLLSAPYPAEGGFSWHFDEGLQLETLNGGARVRWLFPGPPLISADNHGPFYAVGNSSNSQVDVYKGTLTSNAGVREVRVDFQYCTTSAAVMRSGPLCSANWNQPFSGWTRETNISSVHAGFGSSTATPRWLEGPNGIDGGGWPGGSLPNGRLGSDNSTYFFCERHPTLATSDSWADPTVYLLLQNAQRGHPGARKWRLRASKDFGHQWSMPLEIWSENYRYATFCLTADGGMATVAIQADTYPLKLFYKWSPDPMNWGDGVIGPVELGSRDGTSGTYMGMTSLNQFFTVHQMQAVGSPRLIVTNGSTHYLSDDMGRTWRTR